MPVNLATAIQRVYASAFWLAVAIFCVSFPALLLLPENAFFRNVTGVVIFALVLNGFILLLYLLLASLLRRVRTLVFWFRETLILGKSVQILATFLIGGACAFTVDLLWRAGIFGRILVFVGGIGALLCVAVYSQGSASQKYARKAYVAVSVRGRVLFSLPLLLAGLALYKRLYSTLGEKTIEGNGSGVFRFGQALLCGAVLYLTWLKWMKLPSIHPASAVECQYGQLPSGYIRLLELHPGSTNQRIKCSLVVASIYNAPPYRAISYVWGDIHFWRYPYLFKN